MGGLRLLPLLVALAFAASCQIFPAEVARQILPNRSTYKTAEFTFHQLLERHVDRPGSPQLLVGALDGVDAYLKKTGGATPEYPRPQFTGSTESDYAKFSETLDLVVAKYPSAEAKLLERAAADGMAKSMKECHTYYLEPDRAKNFNRPPEEYSGIGALISNTKPTERPEIASVFPNSPAERAGLRAGDRLKTVDGVDVAGFTPEEVANRIRGPDGTTVTLEIIRPSSELTVRIVRAKLTPPRAYERSYEDGTIGSIQISQFNGEVVAQTADAVRRLVAAGAAGIILDLRNNPGGSYEAAKDVASIFVKRGVIVNEVGRDGQRKPVRTRDRFYWTSPRPLVVLVNERSASGAEIVAAGIQANDAGTIVGTKTLGCAGIGDPRETPDGGLLLITLARMENPETGQSLNGDGRGVTPDLAVKVNPDQPGDAQVEAAIAFLKGKRLGQQP